MQFRKFPIGWGIFTESYKLVVWPIVRAFIHYARSAFPSKKVTYRLNCNCSCSADSFVILQSRAFSHPSLPPPSPLCTLVSFFFRRICNYIVTCNGSLLANFSYFIYYLVIFVLVLSSLFIIFHCTWYSVSIQSFRPPVLKAFPTS